MEKVDVLTPPLFVKSGEVKDKEQAWSDGNWIATFNLWIVQNAPIPAIVYQIRSMNKSWAPGKLDVTAGGHYLAGEELADSLREVEEELGRKYSAKDLTYVGRKLHVDIDVNGKERKNLVDISFIVDNSKIESYKLQESEVYALCVLPLEELIKVHTQEGYIFKSEGLTADGKKIEVKVEKDSFPANWDNYHFKIALLAQRFLNSETNLIY